MRACLRKSSLHTHFSAEKSQQYTAESLRKKLSVQAIHIITAACAGARAIYDLP